MKTKRQSGLANGKTAHYMLRRNLPLWMPAEYIEETLAFCRKHGIEEIIWKIDPEDFNHGFTPLELIRQFLPRLERARDRSAEMGILFSINPWVTLNHAGRSRYPGEPPPGFHWRVRSDGKPVPERACPLSPGWRAWFLEAYRLYAGTQPNVLWLEDDFRTFSFEPEGLEPGCYCPRHLQACNALIGKKLTRQNLVKRICAPGKPDPLRGQWFDFQGKVMVQVCRELERIVHKESPATRLGLMQSWSIDGRWWSDALVALAGPHRPVSRTSLAPYDETRATSFLPDNCDILKETACLAPGTENCPELENSPYTPFTKSLRTTRLQILLSQVLGNRAITMNLFGMVGEATADDPGVGPMLKKLKPIINGIAAVAGKEGVQRGVCIPYSKRYADDLHLEAGQGVRNLRFDGDGWCAAIQGSGMPVVLNGTDPVAAVTGQSLRSLSPGEIRERLARGLLLDGSAARLLNEMGYGSLIGVTAGKGIERKDILLSAERDDWEKDSNAPDYMPLGHISVPIPAKLHPLSLLPGARPVSVFTDPDHREVMPGMTLFENRLGGRIAVYPFDFSSGTNNSFMNWRRKTQLQRVIRWLGRDAVSLSVDGGAWMMPVRRDYPGYTFLAVLNFETDDWHQVALTFDWPGTAGNTVFDLLAKDGRWKKVVPKAIRKAGTLITSSFPLTVQALDALVLRICPGRS